MTVNDPTMEPRFLAGIEMLRVTGMSEFQIRFSDDEQPLIWIAAGRWYLNADGRPVPEKDSVGQYWEASAGMHPATAVMRLCERMVDGGQCVHCQRPTGFLPDDDGDAPEVICWYRYDDKGSKFRRDCLR